ncbi:hypothetical protein [Sorangium sp. So ce861]
MTLIEREMNRRAAKDAKVEFSSWRLGGSTLCAFQTVSIRLSF